VLAVRMHAGSISERRGCTCCNPCSDVTECAGGARLIHTLRGYPTTEDFVYLRRIDRHVWDYNPYALEVVPFSSVAQNDFYTLSVRGMAHYIDGQNADFTGALQSQPLLLLCPACVCRAVWLRCCHSRAVELKPCINVVRAPHCQWQGLTGL
jgi:hypothetical protein